jgi:hypothetical protein
MSYLRYLYLFVIVVSNTYCVVFLFCFSSSCVPYDLSIVFKFLAPQMKHSKQKLMRIIYNNGLIFVRNNIYKYNRNLYLFTYRSCLCFLLLCFFLSRRLSLSELSSLKKICEYREKNMNIIYIDET